jgi:hypothetical protein
MARAGFVGQFVGYPDRRTAFWFVIFGPLMMMASAILSSWAVWSPAAWEDDPHRYFDGQR